MDALTLQLLAWIADRPRTYRETMEAWRSSCPRLTIWDDAVLDGLIEVENGSTLDEARVKLTPAGQELLHNPK